MKAKSDRFTLRPERVATQLATVAAAMAVLGFGGQILRYQYGIERSFGLIQQFNLNDEHNLATWFSAMLLLACAGLLWLLSGLRRDRRSDTFYWRGLALIFVALSLDDAAMFHEKGMDYLASWSSVSEFLYFPWVIVGAPLALLVLLIYVPFLKRLPSRSRNLFILSGALFCAGALFFEVVGAGYASRYGEGNLGFAALAHVEESFELAGTILFIYALLDYLRNNAARLIFRAAPAAQAPATARRRPRRARPVVTRAHLPINS